MTDKVRAPCLLCASVHMCLRAAPSDNQGANWGVSNFGALSPFDFQPKNADSEIKVSN